MRLKWILILWVSISLPCFAKTNFYRAFWHPTLADKPLNWCDYSHKSCGKDIANQYCRKMGYQQAVKVVKAHDIGQSRFLDRPLHCKSPKCDGFALIKCSSNKLANAAYYTHYATKRRFEAPRIDEQRLDWCYQTGKQCGQKAAYAFCRYQGYSAVSRFSLEINIAQTRTVGSNELCVGHHCKAFSSITCQRG